MASTTGNALMLICLGILAADLLYAAIADNWLGWFFIPAEAGLLLLSYFTRQAASMDFSNMQSASGVCAAALIAMPLLAVVYFLLDHLGISHGPLKLPKFLAWLKWLVAPMLLVGLFAFNFLGIDHAYNYGSSYHEYTTTRADFLFMAIIFTAACGLLRCVIARKEGEWLVYLKRNIALLAIFAVMTGFGLFNFARGYLAIQGDVAAAEADYQVMFGEGSRDFTPARQVPLSAPELFFGIRTGDAYTTERDVIYRTVDEGDFAGLHLAYDAFLPTGVNDPSAVIMLHGSGGDKSEGAKLALNKYLANAGYAVYDLQVGDSWEKNTGYPEGVERDWEFMLESIDVFFAYAMEHESARANWDSVFVIGGSMGGYIITDYVYNREHHYKALGVNIRGIVPLYGVVDAEINADSLPVFNYTGDHDSAAWNNLQLREKYNEAGNDNYLGLTISYGGHGCDSQFSSRGSQLELYFLERFLGKLRG
jgi:poly(3-hydroxybutyrate) depolymerase